MLESRRDQARGLQRLAPRPQTRVVPVVSTAPVDASRELLRRLQAGLRAQGHAVALADGPCPLEPRDVLAGPEQVVRRWIREAAPGAVRGALVLLHAPLEAVAAVLGETPARPLVAMGTDRPSLLLAYNAIKVLHQAGGLQPIVVELVAASATAASSGHMGHMGDMGHTGHLDNRGQGAQALASCCAERLDMLPPIWPLGYHGPASAAMDAQTEACLLKVWESAWVLESSGSPAPHAITRQPAARPYGVDDVHRQRHA